VSEEKGREFAPNTPTAKKQDRLIDALVDKKLSPRQAMDFAGYSPTTRPSDVINPAGPIFRKLQKALEDKGITVETWAQEYVTGMALAKEDGAKEKNLHAHSKYLHDIGFILTGGNPKPGPQVAVQVNNNISASPGIDPRRAEDLERTMSLLIEALEVEESRRGSEDVHAGSAEPIDAEAHPGVAEPNSEQQEAAVDRGQP